MVVLFCHHRHLQLAAQCAAQPEKNLPALLAASAHAAAAPSFLLPARAVGLVFSYIVSERGVKHQRGVGDGRRHNPERRRPPLDVDAQTRAVAQLGLVEPAGPLGRTLDVLLGQMLAHQGAEKVRVPRQDACEGVGFTPVHILQDV